MIINIKRIIGGEYVAWRGPGPYGSAPSAAVNDSQAKNLVAVCHRLGYEFRQHTLSGNAYDRITPNPEKDKAWLDKVVPQ